MDSVRKRPLSDAETSQTAHKKHIVADQNDAPRVNGTPEDTLEDIDAAKLETFRKQAIYRRMKHYSRENERKRVEIESLKQRNRTSEEGLQALVTCWTQLVNTIRSVAPPDSTNGQDPHPPALFDMISRQSDQQRLEEVQTTIDNSVKATRALITKFVTDRHLRSPSADHDAFQQCQSKCAELEISYFDAKRRLDDTVALLRTREDELEAAHAQFERLRTIQKFDGIPVAPVPIHTPPEHSLRPNGSDSHMVDLTQTVPEMSSQAMQEAEWLDMKASLNKTIDQLKQQIVKYQHEVKALLTEVASISNSRIHHTPAYIEMKHAASFYETALRNVKQENSELLATVQNLTQEKAIYQDIGKMATESMEQDYIAKIERRTAECARLRAERDQARAALRDRELRDGPLPSISQLETLQKSQAARLDGARSEVRRLQARLAEQAGNTEIVRFLFSTYTPEQADFAEHLQKRVQDLEAQISALQRDDSQLPPDTAQLVASLRERDEEISRLKESENCLRQNLTAAETDLNMVSAAYDANERQLKDKVFALLDRDRALQEAQHLRAKAENKYLAAQAEKDSKEAERIAAVRLKDAVEQVVASKESTINTLRAAQRESMASITTLKHTILELENTKIEADSQLQRKEDEWTMEKNNFLSALSKVMQREGQLAQREISVVEKIETLSVDRKKLERERRQLEVEKTKVVRKQADPASENRLLQQELEDLKDFAKCKLCRDHYRTKVIVTCMHSFCKDCVEDRIASRQRHCMTCGVKFAQSDVRDLYH